MAKKTAKDVPDHLSGFEPVYPIPNGYIGRLLKNEQRSDSEVAAEVQIIVQAALPDKRVNEDVVRRKVNNFRHLINKRWNLSKEWEKLIELLLQPFSITFMNPPVAPASSQAGHTSQMQHPEPSAAPPSEAPLEPDMSSQTSHAQHLEPSAAPPSETPFQPSTSQQTLTLTSSSALDFSVSCELPSPRHLRGDCSKCVDQKRTLLNVTQNNRRLQNRVRMLKKQLKVLRLKQTDRTSKVPRKRLTEVIKRKTKLAEKRTAALKMWKAKYAKADLALKSLDACQQRVNSLQIELDFRVQEIMQLKKSNQQLRIQLGKKTKKIDYIRKKHIVLKKTVDLEAKKAERHYKKSLNKEKASAREMIKFLENENVVLQEKLEDRYVPMIETKTDCVYDLQVRKCCYFMLCKNVSVENASLVIDSVVNTLCEQGLSVLPSKSTVVQIMFELYVLADIHVGHALYSCDCATLASKSTVAQMMFDLYVLADIHVGHALYSCDCATLAWDGTTKGGQHLNEVHVSVSTGDNVRCLTVNVSSVAGGATNELYHHIHQSVLDVCQMYSAAYALDDDSVRETICGKIKFTMSDRAAVNHTVHETLKEHFGDMVELKCSVHPLDGLATAAKKVLSVEDGADEIPAMGCRAAELIYQVSQLSFKDGTGNPAAFKAFLRHKEIKPSIFKRYVGNRLNMMFHMAAVIYCQRNILLEFVQTRTMRKLCKNIRDSLLNARTMVHLQVLGFFSKFLSGPWMRTLYVPEGALGHAAAAEELKKVVQRLETLTSFPGELLTTEVDAFGQNVMTVEPELGHVEETNRIYFCETVSAMAAEFVITLNRQLDSSLEDRLAAASPEVLACSFSSCA